MPRRRLTIRGGGTINIKRDWLRAFKESPQPGDPTERRHPVPDDDALAMDGGISIGINPIEQAEIFTEGVSRKGLEDVEVRYLMSGERPNRVDRLHHLASSSIIEEATPLSVTVSVAGLVEFIRASGAGDAGVILDIHTHPSSGTAAPSKTDMRSWKRLSQVLAEEFPNIRFLFGVHGVGPQASELLEVTSPKRKGVNRLTWQTIFREHEIAVFAADSSPVEVRVHG